MQSNETKRMSLFPANVYSAPRRVIPALSRWRENKVGIWAAYQWFRYESVNRVLEQNHLLLLSRQNVLETETHPIGRREIFHPLDPINVCCFRKTYLDTLSDSDVAMCL
ncbi:hypothetical protein TNCT_190771 [Trichonephila clavata]|uniref:Uncharacterized protein n=1 Tax=Trichonephila clavata TaxID=2740835 RepID=A0A8X6K6U1_TRICU|nr:hypothetical protein TNCT_190771 [Trichonephila clavata]